ncbi:MAG: hypothetical protein HS108_12045 [Planctomycetes bacterium]|jgi:hypothetical protein|nr:hypothetical protein [Planctomycetota bacterium]MCL4731003.1 hypothetical protein [Planctomycetota bacterium]
MHRPLLAALFALGCFGLAVTAAFSQDKEPPPQAQAYDLLARRVAKGPELLAELSETWKQAPLHSVRVVKGKGEDVSVELRAQHDGTHLYLLARWPDATQSITKKSWTRTADGWQQLKGDEDRIALAFNISASGFAEKGCAVLCHDVSMRTELEGEKADLWHWKAARGGMHGHGDDQFFQFDDEKGRADDEGSSCYKDNQEKDGKAPLRRWKDDADRTGPFNEDTTVEVTADFKPEPGYTVPSLLLRKPKGSRADIEAVGKHTDGHWLVVFKRKLDTGHSDDVKFEAGKDALFALAVFDDTGAKTGSEHKKSGVVRLRLDP